MEDPEVDYDNEPLDNDVQGCAGALAGIAVSGIILIFILIFWIGCSSKYLEG